MKTKKRGSLFSGLLVFVLLVLVACTVAVNLIFNNDRVPRVAGYYLYMQESDDMEPAVPAKTLVAAEAAVISELHEGNKVLCYLSDGTLALRNIYKIEETDDGTINYYPGTATEQGTDLVIPRTNIFAVCVWASPELYWYIDFATSVNGLMAFLVAPCVLLILMLLIHIARNNSEEIEDEEFPLEEEFQEVPQPKKKKKTTAEPPLYQPETGSAPETLEEKKSSISENFASKPVNENSPYQKAVQEREKTARFKRQELEEEALKVFDAPYSGRKSSGTHVYSAEEIREQARLQAQQKKVSAPPPPAPAVHTAQFTTPMPAVQPPPPAPAPDPVPESVPAPVIQTPESAPTTPAPAPKPEPPKPAPKPVSSSPNIDDILKSSKKKNSEISSTDSIDDLIRLLEKEKNKL
ncbi:MAG: hypothetical protein IJJ69_07095 [Oscillospiraceae bacterium]|nr:hypothetical protein [Oscillospiraceae bacterium]